VLDPELEPALAALRALGDAEISIESRDEADEWWTVGLAVDRGPTQYYLFHRPTGAATPLFSSQPELEGLPLAAMEPVEILARDSLKLHAYLTVPVDAVRPVPAVLLVHGGPWTRDSWGYSPTVQWLANRGYAVLQVNYRGSTGYGKAFTHAGDREWAGRMHDDLIDATDWLIREGIADKQKVAIMGGSYGGYATLVGLTFTPEVFAAGVDIVGPSNLKTLMETIPPYWAPMLDWFQARVGAKDDDEFLRLRSPLWKAHRIVRPLLIGQGANDPRVKQSESEQIVAAMRQAELPVEYWVYQDEGHGFARPENRLHFFARAEAFLAAHLGGRCEPEGELTGHSGAAG
jgi:dipeptidyl aminopeptidase/acylaminoacyl peptidase